MTGKNHPLLPKLESTHLPWPTDWHAIFGTSKPLILDIGFGYGHTLEHLHKTRPEHHIIGLEIDSACLNRAEKAIVRKKMDNVRIVRSRAETALHHLFTPGSLREVHVNFPDPWFKLRHSGRRLMQRDTLDAIVSRLTPGGMFYLATDILAYAEMSAELLMQTPGLTAQHTTPWVDTWPGRVVTKYEKKALSAGRDCYYFAYMRNTQPVAEVPIIKELDMPHLVLQTPLEPDAIAQQFRPAAFATGDLRVKFMSVYQDSRSLLFETYVHDPTIEQHVAIVLVRREETYTLKASGIGNPRATDGLHFAVGQLGRLLIEMHPEAEIVRSGVNPKYRSPPVREL